MSLLAISHPTAGSTLVALDVDGAALIESFDGPMLRADVYVYVLDGDKKSVAHAARRFTLDLGTFRERLSRSGLRAVFVFPVPPGEYQLRALVRSENEALGLTGMTLSGEIHSAADPQSSEPWLLPPFFAPSEAWITALSADDEAALTRAWGWLGEAAIVPSGYPVLDASSANELVVVAMNTEEIPGLELEDDDGAVSEVAIDEAERLSAAPPGLRAWRARLEAEGVEPGTYLLRSTSGKARSVSIPVIVIPEPSEDAQAWPRIDPRRLGPAVELPPVRVAADPGAATPQEQEVTAGYLGALRVLAEGDRNAALRHLYEIETRVLEQIEHKPLELLERLEMETLATLLPEDRSALLPVVLLHAEAVGGYRAGRRAALVAHHERMVVNLARDYAGRVETDDARRDAALVLSGIAAQLRRMGTLGRAREIYRHALAAEPNNEDLVLAIAAIQERLGRSSEAVATLEGLGVKRLGPEARLRLALNLRRTGQHTKAREMLVQLSRDRLKKADEWIKILCYQELATIALDRDGVRAALAKVNQALARWPNHRALRIQSAYLLDRAGKTEQASAILEEMGSRGSATSASERVRYNEWPRPAGGKRRHREMEDRAEARLSELRRLFAVREPRTGS